MSADTFLSISQFIAFLTSIVSLILAVIAIIFSRVTERETRNNFQKTQELMAEQTQRVKEILAEVDKRAAVIERTVTDAQEKLLTTQTELLKAVVLRDQSVTRRDIDMQLFKLQASAPSLKSDIREAQHINSADPKGRAAD